MTWKIQCFSPGEMIEIQMSFLLQRFFDKISECCFNVKSYHNLVVCSRVNNANCGVLVVAIFPPTSQ